MGNKFKTVSVLALVFGAVTITGCGNKLDQASNDCAKYQRSGEIQNPKLALCKKAVEIANNVASASATLPKLRTVGSDKFFVLDVKTVNTGKAEAVSLCVEGADSMGSLVAALGSSEQERVCREGVAFYQAAWLKKDCSKVDGEVRCKIAQESAEAAARAREQSKRDTKIHVGTQF